MSVANSLQVNQKKGISTFLQEQKRLKLGKTEPPATSLCVIINSRGILELNHNKCYLENKITDLDLSTLIKLHFTNWRPTSRQENKSNLVLRCSTSKHLASYNGKKQSCVIHCYSFIIIICTGTQGIQYIAMLLSLSVEFL